MLPRYIADSLLSLHNKALSKHDKQYDRYLEEAGKTGNRVYSITIIHRDTAPPQEESDITYTTSQRATHVIFMDGENLNAIRYDRKPTDCLWLHADDTFTRRNPVYVYADGNNNSLILSQASRTAKLAMGFFQEADSQIVRGEQSVWRKDMKLCDPKSGLIGDTIIFSVRTYKPDMSFRTVIRCGWHPR